MIQDRTCVLHRVPPAAQKWHQFTLAPAAQRFGGENCEMFRNRGKHLLRRHIAPKDPLFIPRLLFKKLSTWPAIRRRTVVQYAASRFVPDLMTRVPQPKGEIDVVKVSTKVLRKTIDVQQFITAVESAAAARAEH